jgi:hypothetical protein
MIKIGIISLVSFLPLFVFGQVNFLNEVDTNYISNSYWNDSLSAKEFLSDPRLNEEFDPLNPDIELLNAAVYAYIQDGRKRSGRKMHEFSDAQYTLCKKFIDFFVPDKFEHETQNIERFDKLTKKALKKMEYDKGISEVLSFNLRVMDFKGYNFYYLKTAHETELKLFKGSKPEVKDSAKLAELEKEPIKMYTYKKLAEHFYKNILKRKYNKLINSANYSSMGIYFKIDPRTLHRNKIPEAAVIIIFGANRLKEMDKAMVKSKRQKKLV